MQKNIFKKVVVIGIIDILLCMSTTPLIEYVQADEIGFDVAVGYLHKYGSYDFSARQIARASNGDLYVVYFRNDGGYNQIFMKKSVDNGVNWVNEEKVQSESLDQENPVILIDSLDRIIVIWRYSYDTSLYCRIKSGVSWGDKEMIASSVGDGLYAQVLDVDDNIHVLYTVGYEGSCCYRKRTSAGWQPEELVSGGSWQRAESITVESNGIVHAFFNDASGSTYYYLMHCKRVNGVWGTPVMIDQPNNIYGSCSCAITTDDGSIHVTWIYKTGSTYKILYRKYVNNVWLPDIETITSDIYYLGHPSLSTDANNYIYIFWHGQHSGSPTIWQLRCRTYTGSWEEIENLTSATVDQKLPVLIWGLYPEIDGDKINRPQTGFSFIWNDGLTIRFYKSPDLTWESENQPTDSWPMFHHDLSHSGYSTSTAPDTNNVLWSYTTGDWVQSSPAVVDEKVYVGSEDNKVYCLNANTGEKIWSYTTGGDVDSSPAIANGKVYVGSFDNRLYCLNADTGAWIWDYTTGNDIRPSPAVANGRVYAGSWDYKVYCLNAETGAKIWDYTTNGYIDSSPAIFNGKVYIGSGNPSQGGDTKIYCLDADTGMEIWNYSTGGAVHSSPAVAYGRVYFSSWDDEKLYCLDADTGAWIWDYFTGYNIPSPAVADGKVYIGNEVGMFYCINALNGSLIWQINIGWDIDTSPAVADGKVYFGSDDNKVYCLNANTGALIWDYTTGNDIQSSPAIANGRVYVGSMDNKLYCFGQPSGNIIYVPDDYSTIQAAVDNANPGYTIIVRDGTYIENVDVNIDHITILSENGPTSTIVQGAVSNDDVFEVRADYVTIQGFTIRGASASIEDAGIYLYFSNWCRCTNNICQNNHIGIALWTSSNNWLDNNTCSYNTHFGIAMGYSSLYNLVENNTCNGQVYGGNGDGIIAGSFSGYNTIKNNICNNNDGVGIGFSQSSYNTVFKNTCSQNFQGICLYADSLSNVVYLNNFLSNTNNVYTDTSDSTWNSQSTITYTYSGNTYTNFMGNYWDDYTGSDNNGDGIGDQPYNVGGGHSDNYPLIQFFENYFGGNQPPESFTLVGSPECDGTSPYNHLSWTPSIGAISYDLYRDGIFYCNIPSGWTTFDNTFVDTGITYQYFVRASNTAESTDSNTITITTKSNCACQPWPMSNHDPQYSGRSQYRGPQTNNVKWSYSLGFSGGSPVIDASGSIYIQGYGIEAINSSGYLKWYGGYTSGVGLAIDSNGIIYGGLPFIWKEMRIGILYTINPSTGNFIWNKIITGLSTGLTIGPDDTIYIGAGYDGEVDGGTIYAVYPNSTTKWRFVSSPKYSWPRSPAINLDGSIIVSMLFSPINSDPPNPTVYSLDPDDGSKIWEFELPEWADVSSPTIGTDGTIYVQSANKLYAISQNGSYKWELELTGSLAIGPDGTIYIGSSQGLYAVDQNKNIKWVYPCNVVSSSVIDMDGTIYFGANIDNVNGIIYALNPDGTLKWEYPFENTISMSPCISNDGTLYIDFSDGILYAFGTEVGNLPPNPPINLGQLTYNSIEIPIGGEVHENQVLLKGETYDPDGDKIRLQIELRNLDEFEGKFIDRYTQQSNLFDSGTEICVSIYNLINSNYHWQARAIDEHGYTSEWVSFGLNNENDKDFSLKVNFKPYAVFSYSPEAPDIGQQVNFDASQSYDPDGGNITYSWDFGDGSYGNKKLENHVYTLTGTFQVKLTITDDEFTENVFTLELTVYSKELEDIINKLTYQTQLYLHKIYDNQCEVTYVTDYFGENLNRISLETIYGLVLDIILEYYFKGAIKEEATYFTSLLKIVDQELLNELFERLSWSTYWVSRKIFYNILSEVVQSIIVNSIATRLENNNYDYSDTFDNNLDSKINARINEIYSLKNQAINNIDSLDATQINLFKNDLKKRLNGNSNIATLYAISTITPKTLKDIKTWMGNNFWVNLGKWLGTIGWTILFAICRAPVLPKLLIFIMNKIQEMSENNRILSMASFIVNQAYGDSDYITRNTLQGLDNIVKKINPNIHEAEIWGIKNYARGRFDKKPVEYGEQGFWVQDMYSEFFTKNNGSAKTVFDLTVQYNDKYELTEYAGIVPITHVYYLPAVFKNENEVEKDEEIKCEVWYMSKGSGVNVENQNIYFYLKAIDNGVYLLDMKSTYFGTTRIVTNDINVTEEELYNAKMYVYPIFSKLIRNDNNFTLNVQISNPFGSTTKFEFTQEITDDFSLLSYENGTIFNNNISWNLSLDRLEKKELNIIFNIKNDSTNFINIPGGLLKIYDRINDYWHEFQSNNCTDEYPPLTIKIIKNPNVGSFAEWVTSCTEFSFNTTDDLSGVNKTYYRIWYNDDWTDLIEYSSNFTLSGEGKHYLEYYSVDNAGNVEETHNQTHYIDDTPPLITIETPSPWEAIQDGVTLESIVTDNDGCGVDSVCYSIRSPGGLQGTVINSTFESLTSSYIADDIWQLFFDTLQLPDGYYVLYVNASDNLGNEGFTTVNFSIRNWAVFEMLPNTPNSKAGRTIPIKFSLRAVATVDPTEPFVRNEELTIKIYEKGHPETILQTSIYGPNSTDYRINSIEEQYITNFRTSKTPKTYIVDIWRNDLLIGSFEFETVK